YPMQDGAVGYFSVQTSGFSTGVDVGRIYPVEGATDKFMLQTDNHNGSPVGSSCNATDSISLFQQNLDTNGNAVSVTVLGDGGVLGMDGTTIPLVKSLDANTGDAGTGNTGDAGTGNIGPGNASWAG